MTLSLQLSDLLYGHSRPLFAPLNLQCRSGDIWAVLGANGRGKSTLLDTLTGVLTPLGGGFTCAGGLAIVPQHFRPAFGWQVRDVVLMGRESACKTMHPVDAWLNSGKIAVFSGIFCGATCRPVPRAGGHKSGSVRGCIFPDYPPAKPRQA